MFAKPKPRQRARKVEVELSVNLDVAICVYGNGGDDASQTVFADDATENVHGGGWRRQWSAGCGDHHPHGPVVDVDGRQSLPTGYVAAADRRAAALGHPRHRQAMSPHDVRHLLRARRRSHGGRFRRSTAQRARAVQRVPGSAGERSTWLSR